MEDQAKMTAGLKKRAKETHFGVPKGGVMSSKTYTGK